MMRSIALGITNISDDKGLILSTVHMAKGLEFDVVFIIGLNDGIFPDYRALNNTDQIDEERHKALQTIWWKRGKSGTVEAWKLQRASFMRIL